MKRITILTALALSIPAAAQAWPYGRVADRDDPHVYVRDRDDPGWHRDRYERYDRSHWARDFRGRWVPLARGYSARTERQFIYGNGERFRRLRVEAVRGEPTIVKVAVEFADGTAQAVDLDMRLAPGEGEVIDLNGGDRRIKRVIVYTDPNSRGAYSVFGA